MKKEYKISTHTEVLPTSESKGQKAEKFVLKMAGVAFLASVAIGAAHEAHKTFTDFSTMNVDVDIDSVTGGSER